MENEMNGYDQGFQDGLHAGKCEVGKDLDSILAECHRLNLIIEAQGLQNERLKKEKAAERDRLKEEKDKLIEDLALEQITYDKLKEENERLKDALNFILNDAEPGEDAKLTIRGYNKACAALSNENYEKYTSLQSINRDLVEASVQLIYCASHGNIPSPEMVEKAKQALKNSTL